MPIPFLNMSRCVKCYLMKREISHISVQKPPTLFTEPLHWRAIWSKHMDAHYETHFLHGGYKDYLSNHQIRLNKTPITFNYKNNFENIFTPCPILLP